jgi:hypothetical protein
VLLGDDVAADREAEIGALFCRFRRKEGLKKTLADAVFGRDAGVIVAHRTSMASPGIVDRNLQHPAERATGVATSFGCA